MNKEDKIKIMQQAIKHYGNPNQVEKAIEEVGELMHELLEVAVNSRSNKKGMITEIADVTIMLEQLKMIFEISEEEHEAEIEFKLNRLKTRMEVLK